MALTIDETLAAAQDSISRHPLIEITSTQKGDDIPFDGTFLTPETFNEYSPSVIGHSSGRLCLAYCYGPDGSNSGIKYVYTDEDRTEFFTTTIQLYTSASYTIKSVSICELTGGNVGIIILVDDNTGAKVYRLLRRIVTVTGAAVSNAEIANWARTTYTSDPWVQAIDEDSYLLIYGKADGGNYYIYKRTSDDFLTWGAESALSIGGLTATWRLANPSIIQISDGDLWLWFDALESIDELGAELTNVYYAVSSDDGASWSNATKVTAYAGYGEVGTHPTACQKVADQMHLIFNRQVGALHLNSDATGWPTGSGTRGLSFDPVNRKLYAINVNSTAQIFRGVVKIDIDTWTVDQYWNQTTTPGFPAWLTDLSVSVANPTRIIQDREHIVYYSDETTGRRFVWYLNGEENTIRAYYMDNWSAKGVVTNVSNVPGDGWGTVEDYSRIFSAYVDADNNRIWLLFVETYHYCPGVVVGYLDTSETSDYQFHQVVVYRSWQTERIIMSIQTSPGLYIDNAGNRIVVCGGFTGASEGTAICAVFDLTSGLLMDSWVGDVDGDFPRNGLRLPFVFNGTIYAAMAQYTSGYGQSTFRGLVAIDLTSSTISLYRPSYCSDDDHPMGRPFWVGGDKIAMTHYGYGVAVFDTVNHTWELYNNDNIPGMSLAGANANWSAAQIAYDSANEIIFVGDHSASGNYEKGVIAFSTYGFLRQAFYSIGTNEGGWSFGTPAQLVQGFRDYDTAPAVDPGDSNAMYCFWVNEKGTTEQSIKWDKDGTSMDLSPYLVDEEITLDRTIDGNPATLTFTASHGHLFDPYNQNSLLSPYLKKGRKLVVRWGEKVDRTSYWQNAGTFYVMSGSIHLRRGDYPVMKIEAHDQRALWRFAHVYATDIYSNYPEDILTDLMIDIANFKESELDIPEFADRIILDHQWIETTLDEILTQICNRFGYYYRFAADGKFSARRITDSGDIDHTYTDQTKIISFGPDDKYSDFTNRVTIVGQERDFTTVIFPEERVGGIAGTLGWWGCAKDHTVWFSHDKSRRCINPRMQVIETSTSIPMQLAGKIKESLREAPVGADNKYCVIEVDAPNLIGMLVANTAGAVAASYIPDTWFGWGSGPTIPIGRPICQLEVMICTMILGSTANYQIDVYAQPLGSVRRSVQGSADDLPHQEEIACIVEKKFEDPLCYSVADCLTVANIELMIARMQRKRVSIQKVAHLQDEDGDTIRIKHPVSGADIDLYITNLRRKFKKGKDGYFLDEIDGWVVNQ